MRVWDTTPQELCKIHLFGEYSELHAVWTILTQGRKGYSNHPETKKWARKLADLYNRHEEEVKEMENRGYNHFSPLDKSLATRRKTQEKFINTTKEQREILKTKICECYKSQEVIL